MPTIPNDGGGHTSMKGQVLEDGPQLGDDGQLARAEQQQQGVQEGETPEQDASAAPEVPE